MSLVSLVALNRGQGSDGMIDQWSEVGSRRSWFLLSLPLPLQLLGVMPGLAQIETTNIIKMEGNIFLGG
jgi:hypothetical protein